MLQCPKEKLPDRGPSFSLMERVMLCYPGMWLGMVFQGNKCTLTYQSNIGGTKALGTREISAKVFVGTLCVFTFLQIMQREFKKYIVQKSNSTDY